MPFTLLTQLKTRVAYLKNLRAQIHATHKRNNRYNPVGNLTSCKIPKA